MVIVTEETTYLSGLLATVTVMTLMTLIYGLILDEGMRLYFVRQAHSAIRSIRRRVARASPRAVWSPPGSFWFL
jgi:cobalamin biosynthesis Mg chelatase CobN